MSAITRAFKNSPNNRKTLTDRDITTSAMKVAITDWFELFYETTPTKGYDPSQRLPYTIVRKLTKTIFGEYKSSIDGEGKKSEALRVIFDKINLKKKSAMQLGLIGGSVFVKPIPKKDTFSFALIDRRNYVVLAQDEDDNITSCGTSEVTRTEKGIYTLEEERTVDANGYLTIISQLYYSAIAGDKGNKVNLNSLEKYAGLAETVTLPMPIGSVGLIPLKMPIENCVDGSNESVSIYAAGASHIREMNRHESMFTGEYKKAESKVIASEDMVELSDDGSKGLAKDMYVASQADPSDIGVTIYNPDIRHESYLQRKNDYLRTLENIIGLKRGILSEVEALEMTATQVTSSAGDYNLTITDLQKAWTDCATEALRVCDILGQIYLGWDSTKYNEPQFDYGDGVLYNPEEKYQRRKEMASFGWLKPEFVVGEEFEADTSTKKDLQGIREKYMPKMTDVE